MQPRQSASRYGCIVADPPWDVGRGPEWASNGASRPLTYPTMTVDEIADLPVRQWADKRAHLYIWTINAYIEETYEIARFWGFKPSTLLTWCKPPNGIGLGGTYSLTTEHVLFARRGVHKATQRLDSTWWAWPRRAHSEKPEAFLDMVEATSPGPYLEMFARRARFGWESVMFVLFSVMGVFFVFYGIFGDDQGDVTFGLACLAMGKAAHAMIRTYDLEERDHA